MAPPEWPLPSPDRTITAPAEPADQNGPIHHQIRQSSTSYILNIKIILESPRNRLCVFVRNWMNMIAKVAHVISHDFRAVRYSLGCCRSDKNGQLRTTPHGIPEQFALFQHFPWRIQGRGNGPYPKTVKEGGQTMVLLPKTLEFLCKWP